MLQTRAFVHAALIVLGGALIALLSLSPVALASAPAGNGGCYDSHTQCHYGGSVGQCDYVSSGGEYGTGYCACNIGGGANPGTYQCQAPPA